MFSYRLTLNLLYINSYFIQELLAWYGNSYGRELRDEFKFPINTLPIEGDDEYGVVFKQEQEVVENMSVATGIED